MAGFDFINAATEGYRFFWRERRTVLRMGVPLFLVKYVSYVLMLAYAPDGNLLRQGLFYLPSYFVEGWLAAQMIRLAAFGERWPVIPTAENAGLRRMRALTIQAAIAIYVLTRLFLTAVSGTVESAAPEAGAEIPQPSMLTFVLALVALAVMLWAFRLLWLHIVAALGEGIVDFLAKARGAMTSVYMIGTWMVCFLPPVTAVALVSEILVGIAGGAAPGFYKFLVIGLQAAAEIVIVVIVSVAMMHGVRDILYGPKDKDDF